MTGTKEQTYLWSLPLKLKRRGLVVKNRILLTSEVRILVQLSTGDASLLKVFHTNSSRHGSPIFSHIPHECATFLKFAEPYR